MIRRVETKKNVNIIKAELGKNLCFLVSLQKKCNSKSITMGKKISWKCHRNYQLTHTSLKNRNKTEVNELLKNEN